MPDFWADKKDYRAHRKALEAAEADRKRKKALKKQEKGEEPPPAKKAVADKIGKHEKGGKHRKK